MKRGAPQLTGKTILVTGATGVLGQALIEKLPASTTLYLMHQTSLQHASENLATIKGDVTLPQLGLSRSKFQALAARIDCIVHAAAITNFAAPEEVIVRTNVAGTENILELAAEAAAPIYYVSTAFVHPSVSNDPDAYIRSKRKAERAVRASGLPSTIVRPSIIVGDSLTGRITQFQGLHLMADLVLREALPVVPASAESYVDFVAQDVVADTLIALIEQEDVGGEYWITTGDQAPSIQRLFDIAVEQAPELVGHTISPPRIVSPDVFYRLIAPVFIPELPSRLRRKCTQALHLSHYMNVNEPLPNSLPRMRLETRLAPLTEPETVLMRNLEYWATNNKKSKVGSRHG